MADIYNRIYYLFTTLTTSFTALTTSLTEQMIEMYNKMCTIASEVLIKFKND